MDKTIYLDKATLIGSSHTRAASPSEDYADFRTKDDGSIIMALSDGCSSGVDSDLASRAWVHGALNCVSLNLEDLYRERLKAFPPRLMKQDMATLVVARMTPQTNEIVIRIIGDGAYLTMRKEDDDIVYVLRVISYSHNMPLYPAYLLKPVVFKEWCAQSENAEKVLHILTWKGNDPENIEVSSLAMPLDGIYTEVLSMEAINGLILSSDGITSLKQQDNLPSEADRAILTAKELFRFKNTIGQFITRRMSRQAAEWIKSDNMPTDDLTLVGAYWENSNA
jgi:hypothetical protein